jgi:hypothetical protein
MERAAYCCDRQSERMVPPRQQEAEMENAAHELNLTELNDVSGGWPGTTSNAAIAVYNFLKDHHGISDAIDAIKQQAGK